MIIRSGKKRPLGIDEPLRHESHKRPVTRRDFLSQGFTTGVGTVVAPSLLGALAFPQWAGAALSGAVDDLRLNYCQITGGNGKVPFIAFDLAGGANIAGSNVLTGQNGDQLNFLSTAGYSKLGIPGTMVPNANVAGTTFVDTRLGLAFHSDSAFLRGMMTKISPATAANINGFVIPARSENDTSNNPHNPMYGIARAGAKGELLTLIGSQNSDSGGNSMAPAMMIDPTNRPTKIDRTSDARALIDTGDLSTLFPGPTGQADTRAVMEAIAMVSKQKLDTPGVSTLLSPASADDDAKKLAKCAYIKTAYQTDRYATGADVVDPTKDTAITGGTTPIFTTADFGNGEYNKTAAVMKLVVGGFAGAGTISMGGFDYHTGDRSTGEARDFRAGECMGACLEYAARTGKPLMLYCFSDGSLNSNGMLDNSTGGRGKGQWTGDNQSTAASFVLVYSPTAKPVMARNQIGSYSPNGDVLNNSSPAANAVNLLVETVILNYMALHGEEGNFQTLFPTSGLSTAQMSAVLAATRIV